MKNNLVTLTLMGTFASAMCLAAANIALAQDGSSISISRDESGGTRVRHITMPNLEALRTPDFTRKDLPIFTERLVLSEAQTNVVGQRIDSYVEAFIALTKDLATVAGPNAEFALQPQNEDGRGAGPGRPGPMGGPMGGNAGAFDDLESELPPGSEVGVSISIGIDDGDGTEGGAPPMQPSAQVEVGIETPDGEDVSPELLAKFQERADELASKMLEQVIAQQQGQADGDPGPGRPQGPVVRLAGVDDMEKHQAELTAKIEDFLKAKAKLRTEFVVDVQTQLAPEQIERWPSLERALTRERSLPKGRVSGESTDLVKLLAAQKLPESSMEALTEQVVAYELELDAALKRRDAFLVDASQGIDAAISSDDPDKAITIAQKAADLRIAVRKANQQYAEQIALAMDGEVGEAFRAAALRAFYPRVYNTTRGQRMFLAVDELNGVPADIAAAIAEMRVNYDNELAAMNEQIRQTMDREEPRDRLRSLENLKQTMQGVERDPHDGPSFIMPDDQVRAALDKRADMDDRYLKSVAALLPPDLAAALPKPRTHKGPIVVRSGGGGN